MTLIIQFDQELTGRFLAFHIMTASERSSDGDAKNYRMTSWVFV